MPKTTKSTAEAAAKKRAAAAAAASKKKKKVATDLDELLHGMDKEDEELNRSSRSRKKDAPPADLSEDELEDDSDDYEEKEFDKAFEDIMAANIDKKTKHSYKLNLVRFVKYLYSKRDSKKEEYKILNEKLLKELNGLTRDKAYDRASSKIIMNHLDEACQNYHPIDLEKLEVSVFGNHLIAMKNDSGSKKSQRKKKEGEKDSKKEGKYLMCYGGHRSAITYLFSECKVIQTKSFLADM